MNWSKETDAHGAPIWRGVDSVFDVHYRRNKDRYQFASVGWFVAALFGAMVVFLPVLVGLEKLFTPSSPIVKGAGGVAYVAAFVAAVAVVMWRRRLAPPQFFLRSWSMTAKDGALVHNAGAFEPDLDAAQISRDGGQWSVPIAAIASVEASPTKGWEYMRTYPGGPALRPSDYQDAIPDAEFQVFLMLHDQTRRVVHVANADREGCVSLAASIRAHIDALRVAPVPAVPSINPSPAVPHGEGFDL